MLASELWLVHPSGRGRPLGLSEAILTPTLAFTLLGPSFGPHTTELYACEQMV